MIAVEGFTKRYGVHLAVENLSLSVQAGEVVALFGPNGSGKSTTLKALAGLIRPSEGALFVAGNPVEAGEIRTRRAVGYLPQKVVFDEHMTIREILRLFGGLRGVGPEAMLARAKRFEVGDREDGLASKLSGGQMQRLGICVALAGDPPVWLLDEPTAGLDQSGAHDLKTMIREHRTAGGAVLLSTHLLADVESVADRVAIMDGGQLVAVRTRRELREVIAAASTLVINVRNPDKRFHDVVRACGASLVRVENGTIEVAAPAGERLGLLKALESEGARLERFSVRAPSVERIIAAWTKTETEKHERESDR